MLFCLHCCFKDKIDNARFAAREAAKQTTLSPPLLLHEGMPTDQILGLIIAVQAALQR
jgi:hypothetical protein